MTIIVEDGTGLANSVAYVSAADCAAYAAARGLAFDADDPGAEPACVRSTDFINATFRGRFPGYRLKGRLQAQEWPRIGAYTFVPDNGRSDAWLSGGYNAADDLVQGYDFIPANTIPREIINATCEGAIRELAEPGSLAPDLDRGGAIKAIRAGPVAIDYFGSATPNTVFQAINLALVSLLMPSNGYSGRVARG